jgi:lactoylglutathione lyase
VPPLLVSSSRYKIATAGVGPAPDDNVDGIRLINHFLDSDHVGPRANGVDADEIVRWEGAPPIFAFRNQDGNGLEIVEDAGA